MTAAWRRPTQNQEGGRSIPLEDAHPSALALLTDLYQLTMAQGYAKSGMASREASFSLFFRENPFGGGYTVACGLSQVLDFLEALRFSDSDLDYLARLDGPGEVPLFEPEFLSALRSFRFDCNVMAVPEGTVVFPYEPVLRVTGPLLQAQLVESALLNLVSFPSLVATKAARVCRAARGRPVLEFGMRRAQGVDGALTASRAAYVGGCSGTSNVLAGKLFGIPVRGTHAHSWVMAYDDEVSAFEAYARAMPDNCLFLVDTYSTRAGVLRAIEVGRQLRRQGHALVGIRLDSGDLSELSREARRLLDDAGFRNAVIVGSGDLDEHRIAALGRRGAVIDVWGVGTRLATAHDQPALGAVYKLTAVRSSGGHWRHCAKISDDPGKATYPGLLQVRRYRGPNGPVGDVIYDELEPPAELCPASSAGHRGRRRVGAAATASEDLLTPVFEMGKRLSEPPPLEDVRARVASQLGELPEPVVSLTDPASYPVELDAALIRSRMQLLGEASDSLTAATPEAERPTAVWPRVGAPAGGGRTG